MNRPSEDEDDRRRPTAPTRTRAATSRREEADQARGEGPKLPRSRDAPKRAKLDSEGGGKREEHLPLKARGASRASETVSRPGL